MVTDDYNPSSWEVEAGGFEPSSAIQTLRPARPVSKAPSTHREGLFHSWFRNPSSYEHGTCTCSAGDVMRHLKCGKGVPR